MSLVWVGPVMMDARNIARYLVRIGWSPESPEESVLLCPLRLQKLLYYCQGWSLALLGKPLFRQPIEAWVKGPVVADVYACFAGARCGITPEQVGEPTEPLAESQAALVRIVWQEYARYTPSQLVEMTHQEPAWKEARADLPPGAKSSNPLSHATMAAYFGDIARKAVAKGKYPMPDPAEVWQADEEVDRHPERLVSLDEAIREAKALRTKS